MEKKDQEQVVPLEGRQTPYQLHCGCCAHLSNNECSQHLSTNMKNTLKTKIQYEMSMSRVNKKCYIGK
jgi:hypothetical protein